MPILSVVVREIPDTVVMGAKYFIINRSSPIIFKAKCPVCEGTQKITYKGYELKCSYCESAEAQRLLVYDYGVEEYIVNEITIKGSPHKNAWTPSAQLEERNLPWITGVKATSGRNIKSLRLNEYYIDPDRDTILASKVIRDNISDYVFTSKALANKAVETLLEIEKKKIAEFNAKFNCNYEYPRKK